jgi:hypothetical protein
MILTMTAKLAICIKSCHRDMDAGLHSAIRETWGKDAQALGIGLFFFMGEDPTQQETRVIRRYTSGEVVLRCPDDYEGLPRKTRVICQWLEGKAYQHMFLCDNDTLVTPKKLLESGYEAYDYSGFMATEAPGRDDRGIIHLEPYTWASGGIGYFVSHRAARIVADVQPRVWAEDVYVGETLKPYIEKGELTACDLQSLRAGTTEHWPKIGMDRGVTPDDIRLGYKHGGWRILFRQGLLKAIR